MNKFYIYCYIDPRNDEPFYIGKGCGRRDKVHFSKSSMEQDTLFYRKMRKLKHGRITPIVKRLVENVRELEAVYWETWFICLIGRRDLGLGPLSNLTDGGEGVSGRRMPQDEISKRAKVTQNNGPSGSCQYKGIVVCLSGFEVVVLRKYVGTYRPAEKAARVYDEKVMELCGLGHYLNFPKEWSGTKCLRPLVPKHNGRLYRHPKNKRRFKGITISPKEIVAMISGRRLGSFPTPEEAARAYDKAVIKEGIGGWLNFKPDVTDGYTGYWDKENPHYGLWDCTLKVPNGCTPPVNRRFDPPRGKRRFIGISKRPNGTFVAYCQVGSHQKHLGTFQTQEEAARARDQFVIKHWGEGWLNFRPDDTDGYTGYWDKKNPDYDPTRA